MKYVIGLFLVAFTLSSYAGTNCRRDWQGNVVCTDDSGYTTTQRRDWQGNTRIDDNYGNSVTCRKTWNGQVRCD